MPKIFPIIKRAAAAPVDTGDADIEAQESVDFSDAVGLLTVPLAESVDYGDTLGSLTVVEAESIDFGDSYVADATGTDPAADDVDYSDALTRAFLADLDRPRSGSPDADVFGDFWGDQASAATAHGNENLLVKGAVLSDAREGFFKFNLLAAIISGLTVRTGGTHALTFTASHDVAVGANNLTCELRHNTTTNPFTESTANWTGKPTGTLIRSAAVSIAAGAVARYTFTFTDADVTTMLGKWCFFRFASAATLGTTTFTIVSRDQATNRPLLTLDLDV